jgi:hypothetical protein
MTLSVGTILKRGTTLYRVVKNDETSTLIELEQINKVDSRIKVFKKQGIIESIESKKMKIVED